MVIVADPELCSYPVFTLRDFSDDKIPIVSAAGKADEMEERKETKWKHLTEDDRAMITMLLYEDHRFSQIGKIIGKDPTTISKEVEARRYKKESTYKPRHSCVNAAKCRRKGICTGKSGSCRIFCKECIWCTKNCDSFVPFVYDCCRENKAPYVCNGCEKYLYNRCRRHKYIYGAEHAQKQYRSILVESRMGADRTKDEMAIIEEIAGPLVDKGQPLFHIYKNHAHEIPVSLRTFYRYVDAGYIGIKNIDLRRVVRYRKRKHKKIRVKSMPELKIGHTYDKFLEFTAANPDVPISEMDIVEGKKSDKKKLLTLMRRDLRLMVIMLLPQKTTECAAEAINAIEETLTTELFEGLFPVILTDNDSAFANPKKFEVNEDGVVRTKLFYCEPNRSDQKGALEKNHEFIRYIIKRGKTFENLTDEKVADIMNHINNTARPDLGGDCPMALALRVFGGEMLAKIGMKLIPADEICLNPQLIRQAPAKYKVF